MPKDLFKEAPEFLALFQRIAEQGFFEELSFTASAFDGQAMNCFIKAVGMIPNDKQYAAAGCGTFVEPKDMIEKIRALASTRKLKHFYAEVKTEAWTLWDKKGENIIGNKGTKSTLMLSATFTL